MASASNEIRIRLEGRLEILETAIARYAALEQLLKGNWQRRAIEERDAVLQALAEEAGLNAAIDHAFRVSERDGWPADAAARKVLARIRALRARLQARLGSTGTWAETAAALEAVSTSARLPGKDELVLLEGTAARSLPLWVLTLAPTLLAATFLGGVGAMAVMVSALCFGLAVLPMGRYVLLVDRLVWIPYRGVPIELPLSATSRVTLTRRNAGIAIEGGKGLSLPVVTSPVQLAALLLMYGEGPLKGINRPPAGTVVFLPASVSRGGADLDGFVLLHNDGLCFLPRGTGAAMLQHVVPTQLELPVAESFMLEQLSRLPAPLLGEALMAATNVPGGICARAEDVIADPMRSQQKMRLRAAGTLIEIPLEAVDYEAMRTLFPWAHDGSRQVP